MHLFSSLMRMPPLIGTPYLARNSSLLNRSPAPGTATFGTALASNAQSAPRAVSWTTLTKCGKRPRYMYLIAAAASGRQAAPRVQAVQPAERRTVIALPSPPRLRAVCKNPPRRGLARLGPHARIIGGPPRARQPI